MLASFRLQPHRNPGALAELAVSSAIWIQFEYLLPIEAPEVFEVCLEFLQRGQ